MTRARAKREGYDLDYKINPQWKTPRKPKSKSTKMSSFQASTSDFSSNATSIVPGGAQVIPSPVKLRIAPRLPPENPQAQASDAPEPVAPAIVLDANKSPHKQSILGSPMRVRPRTEAPKPVIVDKENSPASAMLANWTASTKPPPPKTPKASKPASIPLEASPASLNTQHQTTIKVLSSPVRILAPQTPIHPLRSPRRVAPKSAKVKDPIGKSTFDTSHSNIANKSHHVYARPPGPIKAGKTGPSFNSTSRLHGSTSQFKTSTITDIDSPMTASWVPLKPIAKLQRPRPEFPPARPIKVNTGETSSPKAIRGESQVDTVISSPQTKRTSVPKFPIQCKLENTSSFPERETPPARAAPGHFNPLEELKPLSKPNKWKTPTKGPVQTPQTVRKVCFRTPSSDTPVTLKSPTYPKSRPQSILSLATPKKDTKQDISTTPIESPASPKIFNLSDADDSGFEMFTPRKARPVSLPAIPRTVDKSYELTLTESKPIEIFEPQTTSQPVIQLPSPPIPVSEVKNSPESELTDPPFKPLYIPKGPARRGKAQDIIVPIKDHHPRTPTAPIAEPRPRTSSSSKATKGPLNGVIAFVDVRTADGDDASAPFSEALKNLGARVIKQWNWNGEEVDKIGITHVIFKQGGPRTLSKVKLAKGAVKCVGLGWISRYTISMTSFDFLGVKPKVRKSMSLHFRWKFSLDNTVTRSSLEVSY